MSPIGLAVITCLLLHHHVQAAADSEDATTVCPPHSGHHNGTMALLTARPPLLHPLPGASETAASAFHYVPGWFPGRFLLPGVVLCARGEVKALLWLMLVERDPALPDNSCGPHAGLRPTLTFLIIRVCIDVPFGGGERDSGDQR